ncbi:MAG TPA: hypothetical protein VMR77_00400 [Patescibacteria group bacterium]|jgi:hypothetical protein|nr:hypothetical protein [Patescibacteria group bacterium]
MGLIEDLRHKRESEAAEKARRNATEEIQRQSDQARGEEEKRREELRADALRNSMGAINQVIVGLQSVLGHYSVDIHNYDQFDHSAHDSGGWYKTYRDRIWIFIKTGKWGRGGEITKIIKVQGKENGEIIVGNSSLSQEGARDPVVMNDVFGKVYKSTPDKQIFPSQQDRETLQ